MVTHRPVLLKESIDGLFDHLKDSRGAPITFLDGTLGSGGHSAEVARRFGKSVYIIGLDRDQDALRRSEMVLRDYGAHFSLREESSKNLKAVLEELSVSSVDAILLDLGLSSNQFEESGRGFSFLRDEPLLMTMMEVPGEHDLTAAKILNTWNEETLELIIRGFGEEKYSYRIAHEIVRRRELKPFETTFELVEAINASVPRGYKHGRINPATRTFQALRIAVNEELSTLEDTLPEAWEVLPPEGRLGVISFHSLEDRIVKNFFKQKVQTHQGQLITKKPITPTAEEVNINPRARSAKLRIIKKNDLQD